MHEDDPIKELERLRLRLEDERASFITHWKELADYVQPRRPRFLVDDVNKGDKRSSQIIDPSATLALRTLVSGMMAGVTSPSRPWFRLATPDPGFMESRAVQGWLYTVGVRMLSLFGRSNLYNILPLVYEDMGLFGTAAMFVEEAFDGTLFRAYSLPIGSFSIATDGVGRPNTLVRQFKMTVRQLTERFGTEAGKYSAAVRAAIARKEWEQWATITHVVRPNPKWDRAKAESESKRFESVYYEHGATEGQVLRRSGYDVFPALCPRWKVTGEDYYGTSCPGMVALGKIKDLQLHARRRADVINLQVRPPLQGPPGLLAKSISLLPGGFTSVPTRDGPGIRPIHEVNPNISELLKDTQEIRHAISRAFYEDLFLMMSISDRREVTAREVDERREEKLLAIGPVLEQLNQDALDPLIDIAFDFMLRQGLVPEAPPELEGTNLKVEYTSIMAQAQKLFGIAGVDRFTTFVGAVAQQDPGVLDKVNTDALVDVYGDLTSVPPTLLRTEDDVSERRRMREQRGLMETLLKMRAQMRPQEGISTPEQPAAAAEVG